MAVSIVACQGDRDQGFFSKFFYISVYFRLENSNCLTYMDQGSNSRNLSNSHKAAASSGATSTVPSSTGMPQCMSPFDELILYVCLFWFDLEHFYIFQAGK